MKASNINFEKKRFGGICPEVFYKKDVLKDFVKLTGKHLYWSLFLKKIPDILIKYQTKQKVWNFLSSSALNEIILVSIGFQKFVFY